MMQITEEERAEIEKLSALGYSHKDIAMYFDWDIVELRRELRNPESVVNYHYQRGKLIVKANSNIKMLEAAEKGNITAIQQLARSMKEKKYEDLLNSLSDDEL